MSIDIQCYKHVTISMTWRSTSAGRRGQKSRHSSLFEYCNEAIIASSALLRGIQREIAYKSEVVGRVPRKTVLVKTGREAKTLHLWKLSSLSAVVW